MVMVVEVVVVVVVLVVIIVVVLVVEEVEVVVEVVVVVVVLVSLENTYAAKEILLERDSAYPTVMSMAFDWTGRNLFVVRSDSTQANSVIDVVNVDHRFERRLYSGLPDVRKLLLDPHDGFMYFVGKSKSTSKYHIFRSSMDGSDQDPTHVFNSTVSVGAGTVMTFDQESGQIYWLDPLTKCLNSVLVRNALFFGHDCTFLLSRNFYITTSTCAGDRFTCHNGKCTPKSYQCDGEDDCGDSSDEMDCEYQSCRDGFFTCHSGKCIMKSWQCDGADDCRDGLASDELNCENHKCAEDEFKCTNHYCVKASWKCDGDNDCHDGSDEENCESVTTCSDWQFRCNDGYCVDAFFQCNNVADCPDGSDEDHCNTTMCSGEYSYIGMGQNLGRCTQKACQSKC
ncbi:low-density lipoprotein receptor [Elysia marginata]|uniref:Low-density lipoprotein receptor n=1 Tax=Elysia marginata TaxID=1093978 RepID=A0AAV4HTR8_9GAST|nr:low-density lipoprotein receptor [Elysia marginata]